VTDLSRIFDRAMARDAADLVVDLSGAQFMGAATAGAIVRTRNSLRLRSRSLVLRSAVDVRPARHRSLRPDRPRGPGLLMTPVNERLGSGAAGVAGCRGL
jgi:hypothetical protein